MKGRKPKPLGELKIKRYRPYDRPSNLAPDIPDRPANLSTRACEIWDRLVGELAPAQILRITDWAALGQLCEDEVLLQDAYEGLHEGVRQSAQALKDIAALDKQRLDDEKRRIKLEMDRLAVAAKKGRKHTGRPSTGNQKKLNAYGITKPTGTPMTYYLSTTIGKRVMQSISLLTKQISLARERFGLTPTGRIRTSAALDPNTSERKPETASDSMLDVMYRLPKSSEVRITQ